MADYFVQKQRTGTYKGSHDEMKHVREVLQLMTVLTGDDRFARVTESEAEEGEKGEIHCMCDVLDAIEKRGYAEGETSKAKTIAIKMYQTGCDTEYIAKILDIDVETVLDWLSAAGET